MNQKQKEMRHCCNVFQDYFAADVDRSKCLHVTSSIWLICTHYVHDVSNVIYHKFPHGDVYYRFNGKNVNVMLEWFLL